MLTLAGFGAGGFDGFTEAFASARGLSLLPALAALFLLVSFLPAAFLLAPDLAAGFFAAPADFDLVRVVFAFAIVCQTNYFAR
ncbi:MAG TPA: hypothetical protein VNR39_20885 [Pseudolabrys sp.]|nr:hypothetical protein [Pseudolabrys sp.]